jgi:hypothetical protein
VRLGTLIKVGLSLYVLVLVGLILMAPGRFLAFMRVMVDPVSTKGHIASVVNYDVKFDYSDEAGSGHEGDYFGAPDGNPPASSARIGETILVQYSRGDPRSSCACDAREEFLHSGLPYLGFFALADAALVTTVAFGLAQFRRSPPVARSTAGDSRPD